MSVPKDPYMLVSYINTQLRDFYPSLKELCEAKELSESDVKDQLSAAGFEYDETMNRFS